MSSIITCLRNLFHQSTRPAETYMKASATKYQFQQPDLDRLRSIMHPDDLAKLQQEEDAKYDKNTGERQIEYHVTPGSGLF